MTFLVQTRDAASGQWQTNKLLKTDRNIDGAINTIVENEFRALARSPNYWGPKLYDQPKWSEYRIVAISNNEEITAEDIQIRPVPAANILAMIDELDRNLNARNRRDGANQRLRQWRELLTAAGNAQAHQVCPTCHQAV